MTDDVKCLTACQAENGMPAETLFQTEVKTRLGIYTAVLSARGLVRLLWPGDKCASVAAKIDAGSPKKIAGLAKRIAAQLVAYHCGEKIKFNLPLDLSGQTDFRQRVWRRMLEIPYHDLRGNRRGCRLPQRPGGRAGLRGQPPAGYYSLPPRGGRRRFGRLERQEIV
jgi:hypothetical protein